MGERDAQDLATRFRRLHEHLGSGDSAHEARRLLMEAARTVIPGCDGATLLAAPDGAPPRTVTSSDDTARAIDTLQREEGEGPSLDAAVHRCTVHVEDLRAAPRWPCFRVRALHSTPVRSVLAVHLLDHPAPTVLTLHGAAPSAFDADAQQLAALFAAHAAVLVAHAESAQQAATLGEALRTSRQIGAAVGIVMAGHRLTEPEAFALLRRASNHLNRKLVDVAAEVTDAGELPRP